MRTSAENQVGFKMAADSFQLTCLENCEKFLATFWKWLESDSAFRTANRPEDDNMVVREEQQFNFQKQEESLGATRAFSFFAPTPTNSY